jgi:hypothetical protein
MLQPYGIQRNGTKSAESLLSDILLREYNSRMTNETVVRNVGDLDRTDRSALERVVGHALGESQRLVIQVMTLELPVSPPQPAGALAELPEWADVYKGLNDAEIDDLDAAIRERANLTRSTNGTA